MSWISLRRSATLGLGTALVLTSLPLFATAPALAEITTSAAYSASSRAAASAYSDPPKLCRVTVKGVRKPKKKLPIGTSVVLIRSARANPICQLAYTVVVMPGAKNPIRVKTSTSTGRVTAVAKKRRAMVTVTAMAIPRPGSDAISIEWSQTWRT